MANNEISASNEYKNKIQQIVKDIDNDLLPVISLDKSLIGWTNEVYFVKTSKGKILVVKFFSSIHSQVRPLEIKVMTLIKEHTPKIYSTDHSSYLVQDYIQCTDEKVFTLEALCQGNLMKKIFDFFVGINSINQDQLCEHSLSSISMENFYCKYSKSALDHIKNRFLSRSTGENALSGELLEQYSYVYNVILDSMNDAGKLLNKDCEVNVINHFDLHRDNILIEEVSDGSKKDHNIYVIDFENMIYGYFGLDIVFALLTEATNSNREWDLLIREEIYYNTYRAYIGFYLKKTANTKIKDYINSSLKYFTSLERFHMVVKTVCCLLLAFQGNFYNDFDPGYIARNARIAKLLSVLRNS